MILLYVTSLVLSSEKERWFPLLLLLLCGCCGRISNSMKSFAISLCSQINWNKLRRFVSQTYTHTHIIIWFLAIIFHSLKSTIRSHFEFFVTFQKSWFNLKSNRNKNSARALFSMNTRVDLDWNNFFSRLIDLPVNGKAKWSKQMNEKGM